MKIIEFFGMPRAGKTEQVNKLIKYLIFKKIKYRVITDREIEKEIKISCEKAFEYNLLFFKKIFEKIQETKKDVIILDRGFIDGEVWFNVEYKRNNLSESEKEIGLKYLKELEKKYISFGIFIIVDIDTTFKRHEKKGEFGKGDNYAMNKSYIEDLYNEYLLLQEKLKLRNNILILDGNKSIEDLGLEIRESFKRRNFL